MLMALDVSSANFRGQHVRPFICGATLRSKVWLEVEGQFAIGQGGIELLVAIAAEGSLARAARQVGWSYRHAWGYIRRAERVLGARLITTRSGKGSARGAQLTPECHQLVAMMGRLTAPSEQ
jgi:molybdate transport system regulatory protein